MGVDLTLLYRGAKSSQGSLCISDYMRYCWMCSGLVVSLYPCPPLGHDPSFLMTRHLSTQWPTCIVGSSFRNQKIANDLYSDGAPWFTCSFNRNLLGAVYVLSTGDTMVCKKRHRFCSCGANALEWEAHINRIVINESMSTVVMRELGTAPCRDLMGLERSGRAYLRKWPRSEIWGMNRVPRERRKEPHSPRHGGRCGVQSPCGVRECGEGVGWRKPVWLDPGSRSTLQGDPCTGVWVFSRPQWKAEAWPGAAEAGPTCFLEDIQPPWSDLCHQESPLRLFANQTGLFLQE